MGKRICFISSRSGYLYGDTKVITDWANGRLVTELLWDKQYRWSFAIFSDPVVGKNYDYQIKADKIYALPFPFSYVGGLKNSFIFYNILKKIERENDLLVIQLPIISFLPLLFLRKPVVYHLSANVLTASANPFKYKGLKLWASISFANGMNVVFRKLFIQRQNQLIVNGNELGALFKKFNPTVVVSSSIKHSEIILSEEIAVRRNPEFRILFIGRPSMEKGINVLLEAFKKLVDNGKNVTLTMIGVGKEELNRNLINFEVEEKYLSRISCHGFIPWGGQFISIVKECHCLVMCSFSEGTPRVIIEAMALGCPVIATKVGGVSTVINGSNGLLIPVGKVESLTEAIEKLQNDEEFRLSMAKQALEDVKNFTLERFTDVFKKLIAEQQKS